jgi:ABC-type polysaccharide/polyol phosphate transport system ATPase subunit
MLVQTQSTTDVPLISVRNVSKKYCKSLRNSLWYGVKDIASELLVHRSEKISSLRADEFWALRDVSFDLHRGESLAIIGANGAGKSTLLKLLYGLIRPDTGEIHIRGNLGAMIELGAGLDPVLTGRENIYVRAALLGLKKEQIELLMDLIIDFAGLQDFIDTPVQFYSSGMVSRLAYAVTAYLQSDVLLVDEVLAVGDIDFQRKCINNMLQYISNGGSLILVSHNPSHIHSVCRRGILLENGHMVFTGTAIETLDNYFEKENKRLTTNDDDSTELSLNEERPVAIESVKIETTNGDAIQENDEVHLTVSYRSLKEIENVIWGFSIWTNDNFVCVTGNYNTAQTTLKQGAGVLRCVIPRLLLTTGTYLLRVAIVEESSIQPLALWGLYNAPLQIVVQSQTGLIKNVQSMRKQLVTIDVEWK